MNIQLFLFCKPYSLRVAKPHTPLGTQLPWLETRGTQSAGRGRVIIQEWKSLAGAGSRGEGRTDQVSRLSSAGPIQETPSFRIPQKEFLFLGAI